MKKVSIKDYAEILFELTNDFRDRQLENALAGFVRVLWHNRALGLADKIMEKFKEVYNREHKIIEAEVTSSQKLSTAVYQQIEKHLEKILGNKIQLTQAIDESLLGGFVVRYGDTVLDGSLRQRLNSLNKQLLK